MLKRTVISTLQPLVANRVYTVRHGLAKGLRRRGGFGFVPQLRTPPREELFLERLELVGKTVYDVGGYEGVFTLFFARRVGPSGRVITFEPNPRNYLRILENVRLNSFVNVVVRQLALGAGPGRQPLVFPSDETARGSLVDDIQGQIRGEGKAATIVVEVDSLDRQIAAGLPEPDFVKLDVEGLERDVLEGMAAVVSRRRPALYIEIHGADLRRKFENVSAVIEHLWRSGYRVHHVESDSAVDESSKIPHAIEGHLYCRSNTAD